MARLSGTLLTYLQAAWGIAAGPVSAANIHWDEDWYDAKFPNKPQITITDMVNPVFQRFNTGGSFTFKYRPLYLINIWQRLSRGTVGTQERQNVQDMRLEIARIFRIGIINNWGGSLGPFKVALPEDAGRPLHEINVVPRILRYEIVLITTRDNE